MSFTMYSWYVVSGLLTRASVAFGLYREVYQHLSSDLRGQVSCWRVRRWAHTALEVTCVISRSN